MTGNEQLLKSLYLFNLNYKMYQYCVQYMMTRIIRTGFDNYVAICFTVKIYNIYIILLG